MEAESKCPTCHETLRVSIPYKDTRMFVCTNEDCPNSPVHIRSAKHLFNDCECNA